VEEVKKLVGERIRELQKGRGLSQEELGWKSDLHYTHIGAIERGEKNWSIETLAKVTKGLNVRINDLFDFPLTQANLKTLKKSLITEINESSPEALKIFSDMVRGVKSMEFNLIVQKRTKKNMRYDAHYFVGSFSC
jgi:transcriptional regulator with XRE-family HTH domain